MLVKDFLTKEKWTQGCLARDENGDPCSINATRICRFCLYGAILVCYKPKNSAYQIKERVETYLGRSIGGWQDSPVRTWEEVHQLCVLLDF